MITRAVVENFQSIAQADLTLGGMTCIVGPSDIGKSALLRALRAVWTNPPGTGLVRDGSKTASVELHVSSGNGEFVVRWEKAGSATYVLAEVDAEGEVQTVQQWDKVRPGSVPDEVASVLRMSQLGPNPWPVDVNYHDQLDPPFLLADAATVRATVLGELTGATTVVAAAQSAKKDHLSSTRELNIRTSDAEAIGAKLEGYAYLKDVQKVLDEVTIDLDLAQRIKAVVDEAESVVNGVTSLGEYIAGLEERVSRLVPVEKAMPAIEKKFDEFVAVSEALEALAKDRAAAGISENALSVEHMRLNDLKAKLAEFKLCPTCGQPMEESSG